METYSLFWGGPYSQWEKSDIEFANVNFTSAEQMMMYSKAILFENVALAKTIMKEDNPRVLKKYGRDVKGFDVARWNTVCNEIVYAATYCKFMQNVDFFDHMMKDEADVIVEASPYDKIWGIGLGENDPRALIREEWLGENRLGQIITDVREFIRRPQVLMIVHEHKMSVAKEVFDRFGVV